MNKNIKLTGLSSSPSDYSCADGNLATALNVFHDQDAIAPVSPTQPKLIANMGPNAVIYKHDNSSYKHFIIKSGDGHYYWCDDDDIKIPEKRETTTDHIISINPSLKIMNGDVVSRTIVDGSNIDFTPAVDTVYSIVAETGLTIDGISPENTEGYSFVSSKTLFNGSDSDFTIRRDVPYAGSYHYLYTFSVFGDTYTIAFGFCIGNSNVSVNISIDESEPVVDEASVQSLGGEDTQEAPQPRAGAPTKFSVELVETFSSYAYIRVSSPEQVYWIAEEGSGPSVWAPVSGQVTLQPGKYKFKSRPFSSSGYFTVYSVVVTSNESAQYVEPSEKTTEFPYTDGGYPYTKSVTTFNDFYLEGVENAVVTNVCSIGNILMFHTESDGVLYFKYDLDKKRYNSLGNKMPELKVSFGLETETKSFLTEGDSQVINIDVDPHDVSESILAKYAAMDFDEYQLNSMSVGVTAALNKFISVECHDRGLFAMPFLVRYGYRLYDESVTMLSAPVLMIPSDMPPVIAVDYLHFLNVYDGSFVSNETYEFDLYARCHVVGTRALLNYKILNQDVLANISSEWGDIIKSVDIFISSPFYQYSQDLKIDAMSHLGSRDVKTDALRFDESTSSVPVADAETFWMKTLSKYSYGHKRSFDTKGSSNNDFTTDSNVGYDLNSIIRFLPFRENNIIGTRNYTETSGRDKKYAEYLCAGPRDEDGKNAYKYAPVITIDYECKDQKTIENEINDCSLFYHAKSISINDALASGTDRTPITFVKGYLESLNTKEYVSDDYFSHDTITADGITVYNNRLNLYGIHRKLYSGYDPDTMFQYLDTNAKFNTACQYVVSVNDPNGRIYFKSREFSYAMKDNAADIRNFLPRYFYFPNDNVEMVYFKTKNGPLGKPKYYKARMIQSSMSSGSSVVAEYSVRLTKAGINRWISIDESEYNDALSKVSGQTFDIYEGNSVMTSETSNPFVFKPENVENVGNGNIISLVPQAVALSEGQFGQHPMIAFTTDGIWALSPNATGGWESKQPFSRDVVLDGKKGNILQLDRQIMFSTARGLMMITGSSVDCISEVFDGPKDKFDVMYRTLQSGHDLIYDAIIHDDQFDFITTRPADLTSADAYQFDFKEFIRDAVYLYDYTHQRIIIGKKDTPFCYVYNMNDKLWTSMCQSISSSINSYPECYAMTKAGDGSGDNLLVNFCSNGTDDVSLPEDGFILTRPVKLDDPDGMKTITDIIARGHFDKHNVDLILFGSRDLNNWMVLGTSKYGRLRLYHGTAYKYFRIGIVTRLKAGETLSSLDIEYTPKLGNKMR